MSDSVTIHDLDIEIEAGRALVRVSDGQCDWWCTRESWDAMLDAIGETDYDDTIDPFNAGTEGEGRWRAYEDMCSETHPGTVWGTGEAEAGHLADDSRLGTGESVCEDEPCLACGTLPVFRECKCGAWGYVTDCGHEDQPRPLAPNGIHGCEVSCEDCEA